uniref:CCHC-type domain-containing protein n=1 Tax=Ananas comosus var. bracteatus TaxID=296719 RepID=A0A6V7P1A3_ANACO|nr:unnamed protein product [Ananas comosus var. bracteatus]
MLRNRERRREKEKKKKHLQLFPLQHLHHKNRGDGEKRKNRGEKRKKRVSSSQSAPSGKGQTSCLRWKWIPKKPCTKRISQHRGREGGDGDLTLAPSEDDRRINSGAGDPLAPDLERRFLRLVKSLPKPLASHRSVEGEKRGGWSVNAGLNSTGIDSPTLPVPVKSDTHIHYNPRQSKECTLNGGIDGLHQRGNDSDGFEAVKVGKEQTRKLMLQYMEGERKKSYKEALLLRAGPPNHVDTQTAYIKAATKDVPKNVGSGRRHPFADRCFRCLGADHFASACRDPVRCIRCSGTGHKAFQCNLKSVGVINNMLRAHRARGRAPAMRVVVPYTEDYYARRELRHNAILANIVQPANLGRAPQRTISNALAERFGGYPTDFVVARHRDHDFAVFLPEWVSAERLVGRRVITLEGFWLNCFEWGQYRHTTPFRLPFKAWIRLSNLPFECWSIPRVAAIVGGFGRFLRADKNSKSMNDLRAYRCRVAIHALTDVPQNVSLIVGDEMFPILVTIESWEEDHGAAAQPPATTTAGRANDDVFPN